MSSVGWIRSFAMLVSGSAVTLLAHAAPKADCSTEALSELSATQRFALVSGTCGEVTQYSLETPRVRPVDVRPSLVKAKFGSSTSQELFSGLLGTVKFNWAGQRTPQEAGLRTEQTA